MASVESFSFCIMLIRKGAFCAKCAGLDQNGPISSRIANTVSGLPDFIYIRLLKLSLQSQVLNERLTLSLHSQAVVGSNMGAKT